MLRPNRVCSLIAFRVFICFEKPGEHVCALENHFYYWRRTCVPLNIRSSAWMSRCCSRVLEHPEYTTANLQTIFHPANHKILESVMHIICSQRHMHAPTPHWLAVGSRCGYAERGKAPALGLDCYSRTRRRRPTPYICTGTPPLGCPRNEGQPSTLAAK